jgi:hypothetical protein
MCFYLNLKLLCLLVNLKLSYCAYMCVGVCQDVTLYVCVCVA